MSKWCRISSFNTVDEVIDYNPEGVINENLLHLFSPCPDNVKVGYKFSRENNSYEPLCPHKGWIYDKENDTWNSPISYPDLENPNYIWDDDTLSWILNQPTKSE